jgi:hypothetical protein
MFAGLLASAMDRERRKETHPAFVSVLQQLSSDEALLLTYLFCNPGWRLLETWVDGKTMKEQYLEDQFALTCRAAGTQLEDHAEAYMDNLIRLRILKEETISTAKFEPRGEPYIQEGINRELVVSNFGRLLLAAVHYGSHD